MIGDIVVEMLGQGYELIAAPHSNGLIGYFAGFQMAVLDADEDENEVMTWDQCGHGITAEEAIVMAQQVALGQFSGPVPDYTEFQP